MIAEENTEGHADHARSNDDDGICLLLKRNVFVVKIPEFKLGLLGSDHGDCIVNLTNSGLFWSHFVVMI